MPKDRQTVVQARVTGQVQGVGFRAWTQSTARRMGLRGWVRNRDDGSVLALLAGPESEVLQMVELLWEGPAAARVTGVLLDKVESGTAPEGFAITG
jgi:acylphosphatase